MSAPATGSRKSTDGQLMPALADPVECNSDGLEYFASGDPAAAESLLRKAFQGLPHERGILVNLD